MSVCVYTPCRHEECDKENETYFDEQNFDESFEPAKKHEINVSSTGKEPQSRISKKLLKEKRHECKTCKKKFSRPEYMKIHGRLHTGERPFECKTCKKKFYSSTSFESS